MPLVLTSEDHTFIFDEDELRSGLKQLRSPELGVLRQRYARLFEVRAGLTKQTIELMLHMLDDEIAERAKHH